MFSKGLKEPKKEDYISYLKELESRGYTLDNYNENMPSE